MLMEDMSWEEINAQVKKDATVILVFGAFEAHGKHLPLKTDYFIPYEIGKRVAQKTGALLFPPVNLGFCYTLRRFPGTVSLSSSTLSSLVFDVFSELIRNGFSKFLIINGHGGNAGIIKNTLKEMSDDFDFRAALVSWWDLVDVPTGHADENEASVLLALGGKLNKEPVQEKFQNYEGYVIPAPKDVFAPSGYIGKVGNISKENGEKLVKKVEDKLIKIIGANLELRKD